MILLSLAGLGISSLCLCIVVSVHRQRKTLQNNRELRAHIEGYMEKDRKTTKTILIILAIFLMCFFPFLVTWTILAACSSCKPKLNLILTFHCLFIILTNVNSCINPFVYAFRLPKFRKPVALITKRLFLCRKIYSSEENNASTRQEDCECNDSKLTTVISSEINTKL
jgi:hypothetical protein